MRDVNGPPYRRPEIDRQVPHFVDTGSKRFGAPRRRVASQQYANAREALSQTANDRGSQSDFAD
jgi:hypothetical protein